jgi:hypothetical protein
VIIRESLIQKFTTSLQGSGHICVDDLNAVMEEIEAHTTINHDDATIEFTTQRIETKLSSLGTPKVFTNRNSEDREEQFIETVTYTLGSETSKIRVKGWSVSGGLVGGYDGVQGRAGATYESQTMKTQLAVQGVERTENFDKIIYVPRESRVKISIEKRIEIFTCNVSDLVVTFSGKKSSIKCKCRRKDKNQVKKKTFQLEDVFESGPSGEDAYHRKELTIRLNGKCTWSETSATVKISDPEPLQLRK